MLIFVILCFGREELVILCSCREDYRKVLLIWFILCFRQGRLAFCANKFGLSSVLVGREVKCEVLVIWKVNNS